MDDALTSVWPFVVVIYLALFTVVLTSSDPL